MLDDAVTNERVSASLMTYAPSSRSRHMTCVDNMNSTLGFHTQTALNAMRIPAVFPFSTSTHSCRRKRPHWAVATCRHMAKNKSVGLNLHLRGGVASVFGKSVYVLDIGQVFVLATAPIENTVLSQRGWLDKWLGASVIF